MARFEQCDPSPFNSDSLKKLLAFQLDRDLQNYTSQLKPLPIQVREVVDAAEQEGWIRPLLEAIKNEFPLRLDIQRACDLDLRGTTTVSVGPEPSKPNPSRPDPAPLSQWNWNRRTRTNAILASFWLILVSLWIWFVIGWVLVTWLWLGLVAVGGIGKVIELASVWKAWSSLGHRMNQVLDWTWTQSILGSLNGLTFAFTLTVSSVYVVSLQDAKAVILSDDLQRHYSLTIGQFMPVSVPPWGKKMKVNAEGYRPFDITLYPWRQRQIRGSLDFVPLPFLVIRFSNPLETEILANSIDVEHYWTLEVKQVHDAGVLFHQHRLQKGHSDFQIPIILGGDGKFWPPISQSEARRLIEFKPRELAEPLRFGDKLQIELKDQHGVKIAVAEFKIPDQSSERFVGELMLARDGE